MKRGLVTVGLCSLAMVCLMGAGAPLDRVEIDCAGDWMAEDLQEESYQENWENPAPEDWEVFQGYEDPEIPEEDEAVQEQPRIRFQVRSEEDSVVQTAVAVSGTNPMPIAEEVERDLMAAQEVSLEDDMLIDGTRAPADVGLEVKSGTPYVALAGFARAVVPGADSSWNKGSSTLTVKTPAMSVTAKVGQPYVQANGRYLYVPAGVKLSGGSVSIPLSTAAKIFDAGLDWDASTGTARLTRGSGALKSGDAFYNQNSLFWLSRVIFLESGNQPLEGKMAVGNVVLNRVSSSLFPNTLEGVLAQKNQFTTYRSGKMKNASPNAESVIAAKLVLDGGVVEKTRGALWFDSASSSWASRNRTYVATIGGHRFFA